jgi:hypothetical protein
LDDAIAASARQQAVDNADYRKCHGAFLAFVTDALTRYGGQLQLRPIRNGFGEKGADTKVMTNKIDSKDILYTRGLRLTPQRRTLLDVMATQEHPMTAEAIYN